MTMGGLVEWRLSNLSKQPAAAPAACRGPCRVVGTIRRIIRMPIRSISAPSPTAFVLILILLLTNKSVAIAGEQEKNKDSQHRPRPPQYQAKMHTMLPQPFPFSLQNADGSLTNEIVYLKGNACDNWLEDQDGFSICSYDAAQEKGNKKSWYYCSDQEHHLHPDLRYRVATTNNKNKNIHPQNFLRRSVKPRRAKSCQVILEQEEQKQQHRSLSNKTTGYYDTAATAATAATTPPQSSPRPLKEPSHYQLQHPLPRQQQQRKRKLVGKTRNLVIPMVFANHVNRTLISIQDLDNLMNSNDKLPNICPTGSVMSVFSENSNAQFHLDSYVHPWVTLSKSEEYYAQGKSGIGYRVKEMITEALELLNQEQFDFTQFNFNADNYIDSILFLHSGYAAEHGGIDEYGSLSADRIWSHQHELYQDWTSHDGVAIRQYMIAPSLWGISGTQIVRIGVIAHETAHNLGLPDMNDGLDGNGLGSWSLMGNSWGFDASQYYPPSLDPYSKIQVGWGQVRTLTNYQTNVVVEPIISNNVIYKIQVGYRYREYLLIEYKKKWGFDRKVPREGLVIYHVDEESLDPGFTGVSGYPGQEGWPQNGKHYRVAVLPADGKYDLENNRNRGDAGDVWVNNVRGLLPSSYGGQYRRYPNTDSYKDGDIMETGHAIENIGSAGPNGITFDFVQATCQNDGDCKDDDPNTEEYCTIFRSCAVVGVPTPPPYQDTNGDCSSSSDMEGWKLFELYLVQDRHPEDISWTLVGGGEIVFSGGDYKIEFDTIHIQHCIKSNTQYVFTILDSYGDGLCGLYSGTCGNFTVVYDGETVFDGSYFESSLSSPRFGGVTTTSPSQLPTNTPTSYPSVYPSIYPTVQPSGIPSSVPSHQPTLTPTTISSTEPTLEISERPSIGPTLRPPYITGPPIGTGSSPLPAIQPPDSSKNPSSTVAPTLTYSTQPSSMPSQTPTASPSAYISNTPTSIPTITAQPSLSDIPSGGPSFALSNVPSIEVQQVPVSDVFKIISSVLVSNTEGLNATELGDTVYYNEFAEAYGKTARSVVLGPAIRPGREGRQLFDNEEPSSRQRKLVVAFLSSDVDTIMDENCHLKNSTTQPSAAAAADTILMCQMIVASFQVLLVNEVEKDNIDELNQKMNEAIDGGILEQHLLSINPLNPIRIESVLKRERLSDTDTPTITPAPFETLPITPDTSTAFCRGASFKNPNRIFALSAFLGVMIILL